MLKDILTRLETTISKVKSKEKRELLGLLNQLKKEISKVPKSYKEEAKSVEGFAGLAAHEAMKVKRSPQQLQLTLKGLSNSVEDLETSHPKLVSTVNDLCNLLARIGI